MPFKVFHITIDVSKSHTGTSTKTNWYELGNEW